MLGKAYKSKVDVINVITAPEIEMLIIIKENKFSDYSKVKSKMKPSEYCKQILKMKEVKSQEFVSKYFMNTDELVWAINEYKRLANMPKDEVCLADIIV